MKFYALIAAALCVMNTVEAKELTNETELRSARCNKVYLKFYYTWKKWDPNWDGKVSWLEAYTVYRLWAGTNPARKAWLKKNQFKLYRRFKKMAGGKHYIHWKPVWGKIAKKNNCSFS
jgi:hypothetical protein